MSQPNPIRADEDIFFVRPDGDTIDLPVRIPAALGCDFPGCRNVFGKGPWRGLQDRHRELVKHCNNSHGRGGQFSLKYHCGNCRQDLGANLAKANRHADSCQAPSSLPAPRPSTGTDIVSSPAIEPQAGVILKVLPDGSRGLILRYPATVGTVSCPLCPRVFQSGKSAGMNSVFRHLETVHGVAERSLTKLWTCPRCEVDFPGQKIASHFTSCGQTTPRPSLERGPNTPSVVSLPRGSRVLRPRVSSVTPVTGRRTPTRPATRTRPVALSTPTAVPPSLASSTISSLPNAASTPRTPPTLLPSGNPSPVATASSSSVLLDLIEEESEEVPLLPEGDAPLSPDDQWLHSLVRSGSPHSPQTPNLDVQQDPPPTPAQQHPTPPASGAPERPATQQQTSSGQTPRAKAFFTLWARPLEECRTVEDLDQVLDRCTKDWLEKAKGREEVESDDEEGEEEDSVATEASRSPTRGNRRNQSRQMQRVRRHRTKYAKDASRIQRMFKIYPRRAVREVLGEKSPAFSGTVEEATAYLKETYERVSPSPQQCQRARELFDSCDWSRPSQDQSRSLAQPPSSCEVEAKLRRATNTSPGMDGLEYRHLLALDPKGLLLAILYKKVWEVGIPEVWRKSRTVPIHKKGDTADYSNFRPISLLPTMYKIFSGVLASRLTSTASDLGWLSCQQKGFLPGVHGIQEHTQLLQMAIEDATEGKGRDLTIALLDLCNAFGSVPHAVLGQLFDSLPIPNVLNRHLHDVYSRNVMDFVAGSESVRIAPTTGVRQGDALSSLVFNLASEPLLRVATSSLNPGFHLFGQSITATAYADDLAVVAGSVVDLQLVLDEMSTTAGILGLSFNVGKCSCLNICRGVATNTDVTIGGSPIRCLGPDDQDIYLGIPIGAKLRFRPPDVLVPSMDKIAASLLAPWQKLEVFRSHLLPSLSHHLASGRVKKEDLRSFDDESRKFLRLVTSLNDKSAWEFFYADRKAGGLGMSMLNQDADIWTLARAVQLLTSKDPVVSRICLEQLHDTIRRGYASSPPACMPVAEYLSGSTEGGLYRLRNNRGGYNLWTLARAAAKHLAVRIDVSGDIKSLKLVADDISVQPCKAVRGIRKAVRQRWTDRLAALPHQGKASTGLRLHDSKDLATMVSCRTELRFQDWPLLFQARLDLLPLRGYKWSAGGTKTCRRCGTARENAFHVLNQCRINAVMMTARHNSVLELLEQLMSRYGLQARVNRRMEGTDLRPDVELSLAGSRLMVDVAVSYDTPDHLKSAFDRKVDKYMVHGNIKPLVVGSLGSWYPNNDEIRSLLGIHPRSWAVFRRKARLLAIQGSMAILRAHLSRSYHQAEIEEPPLVEPRIGEMTDSPPTQVTSTSSVIFPNISIPANE